MKHSSLIFAVALLLPGLAPAESKIYKSTDANGNVVYTDVPPAKKEGKVDQEAIVLKETNTWEAPGTDKTASRTPWIVEDNGDEDPPAFVPYETLAIVDPANDVALRENSGQLKVSVSLLPPLADEHQLRLLMDGKAVGQTSGTVFSIENVDRGTHSLLIEIVNEAGESLQQSPVTTFHLQRHHLPRPRPKPSS